MTGEMAALRFDLDGIPLRYATEIKDTKSSKRPRKPDHDESGSNNDISNSGLKLWGGHLNSPALLFEHLRG